MASYDDRFKALTPELEQDDEEEACLFAVQLASLSVLPMTLKAIIELDVLEVMTKAEPNGQLSPATIASQLPTSNALAPAMLDRMLRLLASYGVLKCSLVRGDDGVDESRYGLAPVCKFLTWNKDGVSVAPLLLMNHDKVLTESWYHLKDVVLDGGIPFNKANDMSAFEYSRKDLRFNNVMNKGMSDLSTIITNMILDKYQGFHGLEEIVDVGGGIGATLRMIIYRHPHINGINFDLSHVISNAPSFPGIEHVGGDMFTTVPSGANIFMKFILHGWSDEDCIKLLSNCWKVLPESGKVIVVDTIISATSEKSLAARCSFHSDVLMLVHSPKGKERTEEEFHSLSKKAGFFGFKVVCRVLNLWVMEFTK